MRGDTIQEGDTRVKPIKVTVMSKRVVSFFRREKIRKLGDTAALRDGDD